MPNPDYLTEAYVYRVAPDGQSVKAAQGLLRDEAFSEARASADGTVLRALCRGSERTPYSVRADLSDPDRLVATCNCSSMKVPCKHALGLLLLLVRSSESFERDAPTRSPRLLQSRATPVSATPRKSPTEESRPPADLQESLYQAILAEPEDDGLRLIYADWLEENGQSDRAEFIRVQMELASMGESGPRQKALRAREKALWAAHREEWVASLPEHLRARDIHFHKGFLEELSGTPRIWVKHCDELFSRHPIHRIRLRGRLGRAEIGALAVLPHLSQVRTLLLAGCVITEPNKRLAILFGTPFLSGLRRLDLSGTAISSRELGVLVESPLLGTLRELNLADNEIGPKGAESLAESARSEGLREVSLANNPIGDAGGKDLARSPHLEALLRLDLSGVPLGERVKAKLRERFGERVVLD